jgi:hypothetical protein
MTYFDWLVSLVDTENEDLRVQYEDLMRCMDDFEFKIVNPLDENRVFDAYHLRDEYRELADFESSRGLEGSFEALEGGRDGKNPSFLEVIVGICVFYSRRVLVEPGDLSVAPDIFYYFMDSSGLIFYDNDHFDADFTGNFCCNFCEKSKKLQLFGEKMNKNESLWVAFGRFLSQKMV